MSLICPVGPEFNGLVNLFGEFDAYAIWLANNQEMPTTVGEAYAIKTSDAFKAVKGIGKLPDINKIHKIFNKSRNGDFYVYNAKDKDALVAKLKPLFDTVVVVRGKGQNKNRYTVSVSLPKYYSFAVAQLSGTKRDLSDLFKRHKAIKKAPKPIEKEERIVAQIESIIDTKAKQGNIGELAKKYLNEDGTATDVEVLQRIANDTTVSVAMRNLAKQLLKTSNNVIISLTDKDEKITRKDGTTTYAAGDYNLLTHSINLYSKQTTRSIVELLLHEIVHAQSVYIIIALDENDPLKKEFTRLFEIAKENLKDNTNHFVKYPLTDLDEFIAGIFTNPVFIKELANIKSPKTPYNNLFEEVLDMILSILGISTDSNLYTDSFNVATNIIMEQYASDYFTAGRTFETTEEFEPVYSAAEPIESNPELANIVYEAAGFGQDVALESKLKTFFNNFGFKFEEGDSSTDLLNKIIYTSSKDSSLFINNSVKAISQLLLANTNIDFHKLEGLIEDTPEFKKLLSNSSDYLKTTHKFLKDGNRIPMEEWVSYIKDYNKIKNEVLEKYIKESLLDGKNSTGLHKLINDFLKWFKDLFKNAKNLKEVTDSLVQQVLLNQKEVIINSKDLKNKERVTLAKALEETTHGKDIIKTFGEFGLILTGSVSAAEQGSVFRKVGKLLHDIDWVVPKGFTKDFNKKLKDTFSGATLVREFDSSTYYTQTYIVPPKGYTISNLTFFKPEIYGERKYIASYDVLDKNGNIVSNYRRYYDVKESGKVVENREVYNEGLENVDKNLEAVSVDFFQNKEELKYEPYTVNIEGVSLQLSNWLSSFTEKLKYGRAKDLLDYANFIPNDVIPSIPQITSQQKQQAQQLYSQYLESLNKPNTNPILQGNQQEQVKKFAELQERLNNKEFLEGAKSAYESTPALQEFGTQEEYNDYIARVSLGIIKNPSSGEYNYTSQLKDIVYHGTDTKFDKFDKTKPSKTLFADGTLTQKDVIYFSKNKEIGTNLNEKPKVVLSAIVDLKETITVVGKRLEDKISRELATIDNKLTEAGLAKNKELYDSLKQQKEILKTKQSDLSIYVGNLTKENLEKIKQEYPEIEGIIWGNKEIIVFEPEQIHILGGKQDIEGFKEFLKDDAAYFPNINKPNDQGILAARKNSESFVYTSGQRNVLLDLQNALNKKEQFKFLIAGYAGTGKTTIIENIVNYTDSLGKSVAVAAPTNNAVKVIAGKLKGKIPKNVELRTIHKTIYIYDKESDSFILAPPSRLPDVTIIDEASLIDETILNDILYLISKGKSIVVIGDSFQLEPVGKDPKLFQSTTLFTHKHELTEVRRQAEGSSILTVATVLRKTNKAVVPADNTSSFQRLESKDFNNELNQSIANGENIAVIVPTNNKRIGYNNLIRTKKGFKDPIVNGETLVAISNSSDKVNSEVFKTKQVTPLSKEIVVTDPMGKPGKNIYTVQLVEVLDEFDNRGITVFSKDFPEASTMLIKLVKANRELYDALEGVFMINQETGGVDPRVYLSTYGYSITAHKSQGGQWDKVYIDYNWSADTWNSARWLYTAVTRASNTVILHSNGVYGVSSKTTADFENIAYNNGDQSNLIEEKPALGFPSDEYLPTEEELNFSYLPEGFSVSMPENLGNLEMPEIPTFSSLNEIEFDQIPQDNFSENPLAGFTIEELNIASELQDVMGDIKIPENISLEEAQQLVENQNVTTQPSTSVKPDVKDLSRWSDLSKATDPYTDDGIVVTRISNTEEHFGNPFIGSQRRDKNGNLVKSKVDNITVFNTIDEADQAYRDWLMGVKHQNIKPLRREWILKQINEGKLDGKTLLYYKPMEVYNNDGTIIKGGYHSHADTLAEIVEELRTKPTTPTVSEKPATQTLELMQSKVSIELAEEMSAEGIINIDVKAPGVIPGFEGKSAAQASLLAWSVAGYMFFNSKVPNNRKEFNESVSKLTDRMVTKFPDNEYVKAALDKTTGGYDAFVDELYNRLQAYKDFIKAKYVPDIEDSLENPTEEDSTDNSTQDQGASQQFNDNASLKENNTLKLGPEVKKLLFFINDLQTNPDGTVIIGANGKPSTKIDAYGFPIFLKIEDIMTYLQGQLSGYENSWETYKKVLEDLVKYKPWVKNIIDSLDDPKNHQAKVQFTRWATKHYADLKTVLWKKWETDTNSGFSAKIISEDQNNIIKYLQNAFNEEFRRNTGIIKIENNSEQVDIAVLSKLSEDIKNFTDGIKNTSPDEFENIEVYNKVISDLTELLKRTGLKVNEDVIRKFSTVVNTGELLTYQSGAATISLNFISHITSNNGVMFKILEGVSKFDQAIKDYAETDEPLPIAAGSNPLWDNNGVRDFLKFYAQFIDTAFTNSYKNASGDTVWSYSKNKESINRLRRLKTTTLAKHLVETSSFHKSSIYLNRLISNSDPFKNYLEVVYLDSIRNSEPGKSYSAKPIDAMSPREMQIFRMSALFNQGRNWTIRGNLYRLGILFNMTMSDKSVLMGLNTLLHNTAVLPATINTNLKLGLNTIDALSTILQAEYERIYTNNQIDDSEVDVKGYREGRKYFLILPMLNNDESINAGSTEAANALKAAMYNQQGVIGKSWEAFMSENNGKNKKLVTDFFTELVDRLSNKQLDEWANSEIYNNETGELNYVDSKYFKFVRQRLNIIAQNANTVENKNKVAKFAAVDYTINYLLHYTNYMQMFSGDPAMYFKKAKDGNMSDHLFETLTNLGKRLASENAPGEEGSIDVHNEQDLHPKYHKEAQPTANAVITKDLQVSSMAMAYINNILDKDNASEYKKIDATDASELNTLQEFAFRMLTHGYLSKQEYQEILDNYYNLPPHLLKKVIGQAIKPVHRGSQLDENLKAERIIYLKTAAFPMIPQLMNGLPLDIFRKQMEEDKNGNLLPFNKAKHRWYFDSGAKVGAKLDKKGGMLEVWDNKTGNIGTNLDLDTYTLVLDRNSDRIQQEVPFKAEKAEVNRSSQVDQNLFVDWLDEFGFIAPSWSDKGGKAIKGAQLKQIYDRNQKEIYDLQLEEFYKEMCVEENGKQVLDRKKLLKAIEREAVSRNYPPQVLAYLKINPTTNKFKYALKLIPEADKIESLLLSIIDNRLRKKKMPGFSGVLAPEAGFNGISKDIVYTANNTYNPEKGLKPQRITFETKTGEVIDIENKDYEALLEAHKNGKLDSKYKAVVRGSQILVPWKFRNGKGEILDMNQFIKTDEKGNKYLDTDKIDPEILEMFGFRIPNQGPNSKAFVEVVGFLPWYMGDLVIATKDFTKQMGSDFDVDKLYTYIYATTIHQGKLKKLTSNIPYSEIDKTAKMSEFDYKLKVLQNRNLDVHLAAMSSNNVKVQSDIITPLGFLDLKSLAAEIAVKSFDFNNGLVISDMYQINKYLSARGGKVGTGIFSLSNTGNAQLQGKNIDILQVLESGNRIPLRIPLTVSHYELSKKITSLSSTKSVNDVSKHLIHAAFQSAAVDEEKEQILSRLNISNTTMPIIWSMIQMGYDTQDIVYLLNQPIVKEFATKIKNKTDSTTKTGVKEAAVITVGELFEKYLAELPAELHTEIRGFTQETLPTKYNPKGNFIPLSKLKSMLNQSNLKDFEFVKNQLWILSRVIEFNEHGLLLNGIFSSTNTYAKGMGLNLFVVNSRLERISKYSEPYSLISNYTNLLGNTVTGLAINNALKVADSLFNSLDSKDLFYYNNKVFKSMFNALNILGYVGDNKDAGIDYLAKVQKDVSKEFNSYMNAQFTHKLFEYMNRRLKLTKQAFDPLAFRKHLYMNYEGNTTLAAMVLYAQNTEWGKSNQFLNKLEVKRSDTDPRFEYVTYPSGKGVAEDEKNIYQGFADLLSNKRSFRLGMYLIMAAYLAGGKQQAMQYTKYIPPAILEDSGFLAAKSDVDLNQTLRYSIDTNLEMYGITSSVYPGFIYQYMQNNSADAPTMDKKSIAKDDQIFETIEGFNILTAFKVKAGDESIYMRVVNVGDDFIATMLPVVKLTPSKGINRLYAFDPSDGYYKYIPTVGVESHTSEYYHDRMIAESTLGKPGPRTNFQPLANRISLNRSKLQSFNLKLRNSNKQPVRLTMAEVRNILTADTGNTAMDLIGQRLVDMGLDRSLEIMAMPDDFNNAYRHNKVSFYASPNDIKLTKKRLIHEYSHALLNTQIRNYAEDKSSVTPNQAKAIKNIGELKNHVLAILERAGEQGIDYNGVIFKYSELQEFNNMYWAFRRGGSAVATYINAQGVETPMNAELFSELRDKYYGLNLTTLDATIVENNADIGELITAIFDNTKLINLLNSVTLTSEDASINLSLKSDSVFKSIIKNFSQMLKQVFGVAVNTNSALEALIENIVLLTDKDVAQADNMLEFRKMYDAVSNKNPQAFMDEFELYADYQQLSKGNDLTTDEYFTQLKCKYGI